MRYTTLRRTGLKASVLACGSHIGVVDSFTPKLSFSLDQINVAYNYALDKGINVIVTNTAYKIAEDTLYQAIGQRRDEYILSIGTDFRSARLAEKDIKKSLGKFHTNYIDLYQMGGFRRVDAVDSVLRSDGALSALLKAKKEGKIGHIGVTGHNIEALVKLMKTGVVECCQFVFNVVQRRALRELIPVAKEYDVDLFAMRPLEDGWFSGKAYDCMRFIFSSPVDVVISGMYSKKVIDANIKIADPEPSRKEWVTLLKEAETIPLPQCEGCMLCRGHWTEWNGAACPRKIDIYDLMIVRNFRKKYGLSSDNEKRYRESVEKIKDCDQCMRCCAICIFNLPVDQILDEIKREL